LNLDLKLLRYEVEPSGEYVHYVSYGYTTTKPVNAEQRLPPIQWK